MASLTRKLERGRAGLSSLGIHAILIAYSVLALFPLYLILLNSFKSRRGIFGDPAGLPNESTFSTKGYQSVITNSDFPLYFGNSLVVTGVALFFILLFGAMAAHALSEYDFPGSTFIGLYLILGIMVPIRLGTVALLKLIVDLNLANTLTALILVYTAQGLPVAIFIFSEFLKNVSHEIKDSARIDGLSEYRIFFEVVIPLVRPVIATVAVFSMIPIWNDLWFPLILSPGESTRTVTLGVQKFVGQYTVDWGAVLAALSVAVVPVLFMYIIFSKQLIRGITAGAVKG